MSASTNTTLRPESLARSHGSTTDASTTSKDRSSPSAESRNPLARWYEQTSRPWIFLLLVICCLYLPSLGDGFILDDHRALRVLQEYASGERSSPSVYRFLSGDAEANRSERAEGWYPWWIADDLKYQHMRPLAEWLLYLEYRLFDRWAPGYRLVNLFLYAAGVLLVLRLFRLVSSDERLARWGALLFAVATSHAIPVLFVSSQGDVVALVCVAGAMLCAETFVETGRISRLMMFLGLFAAGLGMKEAVLPVAVAPLMFHLFRRSSDGLRRGLLGTALSVMISLVWLSMYVRDGFGSNTSVMLDPIHDTADYLRALPLRALLLLSTWVVPVNPFLFEFQTEFKAFEWIYAVQGGATLAILAVMYWRYHRRQNGVVMMALWVPAFLPILVCTPPDDRVMMLPSIGLAYLGAAWLTRPRSDGTLRLRVIPLLLFVVLQVCTVWITGRLLAYLESQSQRHVRLMAESFGRPMVEEDHIFVLNNPYSFEGLFMQDRLRSLMGPLDGRAAILSDVRDPSITVVDERAFRLDAGAKPLLSSFLGRMGTTRARPRATGDTLAGGDFIATILKADAAGVQSVELRFNQPLTSERYRFFLVGDDGCPVPWRAARGRGPSGLQAGDGDDAAGLEIAGERAKEGV